VSGKRSNWQAVEALSAAGLSKALRSSPRVSKWQGRARPQAAGERPHAEHAAALWAKQTSKRGSLGCGRNYPAAELPGGRHFPEEPNPPIEAPRSATLASRAAPAPSQVAPNLLQRAGARNSGILQHCFL
jgi:hypothetical protein